MRRTNDRDGPDPSPPSSRTAPCRTRAERRSSYRPAGPRPRPDGTPAAPEVIE